MRALLLSLALALLASATLAEETAVGPEATTVVIVSNRDVNRVNCPANVEDVVWSKEKPATVKIDGANVFVKFLMMREGDVQRATETPLDLHVVCEGAVYTMILHPKPIDSVTVRLKDTSRKELEQTVKDWSELSLDEKVQRLTLVTYHHEEQAGFVRKRIDPSDKRAHIADYQDMLITGESEVFAPGTGLRATEYSVVPTKNMNLQESDFLLHEMGDIVGVTIDPLYVPANGAARVIVITRSIADAY